MITKVACPTCLHLVPMMAKVTDAQNPDNPRLATLTLEIESECQNDMARLNRCFPLGVEFTLEVKRSGNKVSLTPIIKNLPAPKTTTAGEESPVQKRERAIELNIAGADKMTDTQVELALAYRAEEIGKGKRGVEASRIAAEKVKAASK